MSLRAASSIARHHGLDWLRIAAFALLILFHIGMFFAPGSWIVKTEHPIGWIGLPMLALMPWRLPLLFVVSGYASRALLAKLDGPGAFVRARSKRLLIPLAFGVIAIVPPQSWVRHMTHGGYREPLGYYWLHDWFPAGVSAEHLWFVVSLWTFSLGLAAALALIPPVGRDRIQDGFGRLAIGRRLIWVPLAVLEAVRLGMLFTVPEAHGLFNDWVGDATYVPAFLFGSALAGTPALWPAILRSWRPALAIAIAGFGMSATVELAYADHAPHLAQAARRTAELAMGWSTILLLLGVAHRWLARDHPWRQTLSEAVFPFYLIHQTIIVVVGWSLLGRGIGAGTQFAILLFATVAGCWLFYAVGRRIGWLRPLIGLSPLTMPRLRTAIA